MIIFCKKFSVKLLSLAKLSSCSFNSLGSFTNLLKFELCYLVKKEINWIVYHTPDEIQKFFKKIHRFIKNDESAMKVMKVTSLEKIK